MKKEVTMPYEDWHILDPFHRALRRSAREYLHSAWTDIDKVWELNEALEKTERPEQVRSLHKNYQALGAAGVAEIMHHLSLGLPETPKVRKILDDFSRDSSLLDSWHKKLTAEHMLMQNHFVLLTQVGYYVIPGSELDKLMESCAEARDEYFNSFSSEAMALYLESSRLVMESPLFSKNALSFNEGDLKLTKAQLKQISSRRLELLSSLRTTA